jgi:hypothetical protein
MQPKLYYVMTLGVRRQSEFVQAITPDPLVDFNNILHDCCPGPKEMS